MNTNRLPITVVAACFIIGYILFGQAARKPEPQPAPHGQIVQQMPAEVPRAATPTDLVLPEDQRVMLDYATEALAHIAARSQTGKQLFEFGKTAALPGRYLPDVGGVQVLVAPTSPLNFQYAADPTPQDPSKPAHVGAVFHCAGAPTMLLHAVPGNADITVGLLLAHELVHALDCVVNHEPESEQLTDNWLIGEMHAYSTLAVVLNEYTDGQWQELVEQSYKRRQAELKKLGKRPESFLFMQDPTDIATIQKLFNTIDPFTIGTQTAQLDIDTNMFGIDKWTAHYNNTTEEKLGIQLEFMRAYYGRMTNEFGVVLPK